MLSFVLLGALQSGGESLSRLYGHFCPGARFCSLLIRVGTEHCRPNPSFSLGAALVFHSDVCHWVAESS